MQLRNSFPVPAAPDEAYAALLDLERVAPCMPGAQLTGSDGDTYHGRLKLRIGPITAAYQGTVTIERADADQRTAELSAAGEEIGGQGVANARVVASVHAAPDGGSGSEVQVVTELDIRGKAAQFGRGALGEVTQRVLDQFARNLESTFAKPAGDGTAAGSSSPGEAPAGTALPAPAGGDLDVLSTIVLPMAKKALPAVAALLLGLLLGRLSRTRNRAVGSAATSPWAAAPPWAQWGPPPWGPSPTDPQG